MMNDRYDPAAVEAKWQRLWRERRTNTVDLRRAADDPGNKGFEAAMTAVETANLLRQLG